MSSAPGMFLRMTERDDYRLSFHLMPGAEGMTRFLFRAEPMRAGVAAAISRVSLRIIGPDGADERSPAHPSGEWHEAAFRLHHPGSYRLMAAFLDAGGRRHAAEVAYTHR